MPSNLARDLTYAWRRLRRAPGFTFVAALTLALGIGANTAVFSVLDPLLLRRLAVANPDELVLLHSVGTLQTVEISERAAFDAYSTEHDVLAGVLADAGMREYRTASGGLPAVARGQLVSGNYFAVLGVQPLHGRLLVAEDDAAGQPVVVLSFDYWVRAFGADRTVVGQALTVNGKSQTIVGIAPPRFLGIRVESPPDFYLPFGSGAKPAWVTVLARLRPGVSLPQARSTLEAIFRRVVASSSIPEVDRQQVMAQFLITPASRGLSDLRERFGLPAWVLMAVVGLVLVVACANVANLVLTQSAGRRNEIATRLALGATRGHLVRALVTESGLLAGLGAAAGLLAAQWLTGALVAALSIGRAPVTLATGINVRVALFTAGVLALTVLLCGVLPALASTRADLVEDLKSRTPRLRRGGKWRADRILVVAQIGVSVTLLAGAGLLLRSLVNLSTFNVGFDRDRVLSVSLADSLTSRPPEQATAFFNRLLEQVRSFPGVQGASLSALAPVSGTEIGINVVVEGAPFEAASSHAFFTSVAPDYFATLGIPMVAGRDFSAEDDSAARPVVIINRTMARHYFGDDNPLGQRLRFVQGNRPPMEIIGVVADAIYNDLREPATDFLYLCRPRLTSPPGTVRAVLVVRTDRDGADALAGSVQQIVQGLDTGVKVAGIKTLQQYIDESLRGDRVIAGLTSAFSLLALLVAAIGLYGVLSVSVAERTPEIGLRMALGADSRHILWLIGHQGGRLVVLGLLLGGAGAFATTSVLTSLLFGLDRADPLTLAGVVVALAAVAALACYVPARRAMRISPIVALRSE